MSAGDRARAALRPLARPLVRPVRRYLAARAFRRDAARALARMAGGPTGAGGPARPRPPLLLGYYPSFTTNPYQALLYGATERHGIAAVPIRTTDLIPELTRFQRLGTRTVLHLHWLHRILGGAATRPRAERLLAAFLRLVDDHRAAGGSVVWTVHNILPHEARFEDLEARLSAEVARRADVIHVLAAGTAAYVAPHFELSAARLLYVPHPSYAGAYEDDVTRADARRALGIGPDEFVYAVVGAIRPYKGLTTLLDAWQGLPADRPRRLVIAGAAADGSGIEALLDRAGRDPSILVHPRKIPAPEIQRYLRAADVAVMPYVRSLNSGALALAITFGLPVIVPAGGGLAEMTDPRFARAVPPGDVAALSAALHDAPTWATHEARAAATERAAELAPAIIAERFASGLRERLGA